MKPETKPETNFFIGIDPGQSGAVAMINSRGDIVSLQDTPVIHIKQGKKNRTKYVESQMATILDNMRSSHSTGKLEAVIEAVHAMPAQGVTSMFSMGMGFGLWVGILAALRIPYRKVEPVVWKRAIGIVAGSSKNASIIRAQQAFPGVSFRKDKGRVDTLDGRADALLLAEYLRKASQLADYLRKQL